MCMCICMCYVYLFRLETKYFGINGLFIFVNNWSLLIFVPVTRSVFCMTRLRRCLSEMHVVNKFRRKWVFCDSCFCDFKMSCFSPNFVKVSFIIEFLKGISDFLTFLWVIERQHWTKVGILNYSRRKKTRI